MPAVMPATLAPRTLGARARAREVLAPGPGWDRRFRLSLEVQRLRDRRLHPHDLSVFSSNQFHLYRLNGRVVGTLPTPRWEWFPAGRRHLDRLGPVGRIEPLHLPAFDLPPWYHNVPTPPNLHFTHMDMNHAYTSGKSSADRLQSGGNGTSSGGSGARSKIDSGIATLMGLTVLVLLARVLGHCLELKIFKRLWRRSGEWFKLNVLATSHHVRGEGAETGLECPEYPPLPPDDPPPPYSRCLPKSPAAESPEPPPPYSACFVAFPRDLPTVHLNVPTPYLFQDTGQITEVAQDEVPVVTGIPRSRDGLNTDPAQLRPNSDVASQGATVFQIV